MLGARMLRRAGANVNATNEMGQTPLMVAALIPAVPNKIGIQHKFCRYLVEECGADVNIRDKGGFTTLDYVAMNQDAELIKLFLKNGALTRRDNFVLAAKRKSILHYVSDPECYKLLHDRLEEETKAFNKAMKIKTDADAAAADVIRLKKLHKSLAKKRDAKIALTAQREREALIKEARDVRIAKFNRDEDRLQAQVREQVHKFGDWTRDPTTGHWEWSTIAAVHRDNVDLLLPQARAQMIALRDSKSFDKFNKRWKSLTGGNEIEAEWRHSKPFDLPEFEPRPSTKGAEETSVLGDELLNFRDENDAELEGEDLGDIMQALTGAV